jgi:hypothetical protein
MFPQCKGFLCLKWPLEAYVKTQLEISRGWIMKDGENGPLISLYIFCKDRILFPARIHMPADAMLTRTEVMTVTGHRWGIHLFFNVYPFPPLTGQGGGRAERVNQRDVRILDKWRGQKETCELDTGEAFTCVQCFCCLPISVTHRPGDRKGWPKIREKY